MDGYERATLYMSDGSEIEVKCPNDIAEEFWEEMEAAQGKDSFWFVGNWMNASASRNGVSIDYINMKRLIAYSS